MFVGKAMGKVNHNIININIEDKSHCVIMHHALLRTQVFYWGEQLNRDTLSTFISVKESRGLNN